MAALPEHGIARFALPVVEIDDRAERAALARLYERQAPRIHRFLRDLLGDGTLAMDATQETFARAFRSHREVLRDPERAVPWLFGVARKVALELRKARARAGRVIVDGAASVASVASVASGAVGPEGDVLGRETIRALDRALARLSEERREVLLLRLDHGLSYDDISQITGFSLAKVKVEIHRARESLRDALEEHRTGRPRREKGERT